MSLPSKCMSSPNVDDCKDNVERYYFDFNTKTCKIGCNINQFTTREACEEQCLPLSIRSKENESEQAFETKQLGSAVDGEAPDGSDVRLLLSLARGSMAHFSLDPGKTSRSVQHRTVDEIWFFVTGEGEMWRKQGNHEAFVMVRSGTCITIPVGTQFQFRSFGNIPLTAVGITMQPWPGDSEPMFPSGVWNASLVSTWVKPTSTASVSSIHSRLIFTFFILYKTFLS